ncbi:VOC family protein [Allosaccharopolyspora coralli]|uniref:VOC family protein n=1 Tax=Allosaccharopolyspora coralli TaxID=2665642 RepID=UPI00165207BD|nr:VOC family protein [Allosaccharopolyspora coralli]
MSAILGHLTLSVTDVARSRVFYTRLLGAEELFSGEDEIGRFSVLATPRLRLGLRAHAGGLDRFDPRNVGLDHLAFHVAADELDGWRERLVEAGASPPNSVTDTWGHTSLRMIPTGSRSSSSPPRADLRQDSSQDHR